MSHVSSLSHVGLAAFAFILECSQWPIVNAFHSNCSCLKVPAFCLSFLDGCIIPELPVNLFLIICFYWKPHFLCCLPICEFGPDWALTSVHRAKGQPRPWHRSIITMPPRVYGKSQSRQEWKRHLSDLCLGSVARQQVALLAMNQINVEHVCPAESAMQGNFNPTGQGVFGWFGSPFFAETDIPLKPCFHENRQWLLVT